MSVTPPLTPHNMAPIDDNATYRYNFLRNRHIRRRAVIACLRCRKRKIRCDATRKGGRCSNCTDETDCVVIDPGPRAARKSRPRKANRPTNPQSHDASKDTRSPEHWDTHDSTPEVSRVGATETGMDAIADIYSILFQPRTSFNSYILEDLLETRRPQPDATTWEHGSRASSVSIDAVPGLDPVLASLLGFEKAFSISRQADFRICSGG